MNEFAGTRITTAGRSSERKRSVLYTSSVVYLSFLAIERIDFLRGQGTFGLTPELIGSIFFLLCFLFHVIYHKGKLKFSNQLKQYTKILFAFMATVVLSVPFSSDAGMSARRVVLLAIYVFSGLLSVNYLITYNFSALSDIIVNGMVVLSVVYAVGSLYDVFAWLNPLLAERVGSIFPFFRTDLLSVGALFVRARGASGDPNRAGIFMIVNTYIMLCLCKRRVLKIVICVINVTIMALTVSRTTFLCAALYVVLSLRASKKINKKTIFRMAIILLLVIGIVVGLYQVPIINEAVDNTLDRLQTRDDSANQHIDLIETGVIRALTDFKILLIGNGYGASSDILNYGKYFNFHNAFVSYLVECGLLSVLLFIILLLYPLYKDKSQLPIAAVLVLANIPYQIYNEPYFWFILPLLCIMPKIKRAHLAESECRLEES